MRRAAKPTPAQLVAAIGATSGYDRELTAITWEVANARCVCPDDANEAACLACRAAAAIAKLAAPASNGTDPS